jgi:hypothetical protein
VKKMRKNLWVAFALLAVTPGLLQGQRPESATQRIEAAQARVAQAGIPVELLAGKVAEGRAKGATEERIAEVAERRAAGLLRSQEALANSGRRIGGAEIGAGADALDAGVDANSLRSVIQQAREDNAAVALAVLGELVRQGLPVQQAHDRVTAALQRGDDALANLPQQAAEARARRGPPEGAGPPAGAGRLGGVGNAPGGTPGGPPAGVPAPGTRPGGGPPAGTPSGGRPGNRP